MSKQERLQEHGRMLSIPHLPFRVTGRIAYVCVHCMCALHLFGGARVLGVAAPLATAGAAAAEISPGATGAGCLAACPGVGGAAVAKRMGG